MKKKNLSQKLNINKSKIASFDQRNSIKGGINSVAPDRCDSIITMECTDTCNPPTGGGGLSVTCPPATDNCPSANTVCRCDSFITMAGITGC